MTRSLLLAISLPWLLAAGCADPIGHALPDASRSADPVTTSRVPDGSFITVIDATSETVWTQLDFETGGELASGPWDLRFLRFHISANGGSSGTGGVMVAPITDMTFAEVKAAPATGWISDAPDGDDPNTDPDYAFEQGDGWYDYDVGKHTLSPKPVVWVVATDGGATIKLEITRYYDFAGTPAWPTLHWQRL